MPADELTRISPPAVDYAAPVKKPDRLWAAALLVSLLGFGIPLIGFGGAILGLVAMRRDARSGRANRSHALAACVLGVISGLITGAVSITILLHLLESREIGGRVRCARQMRVLGDVMMLYAAEHRGNYPTNLSGLLSDGSGCVPELFVCPRGNGFIASTNFTSDPAARAAQNLDYIYVGEGLTNMASAEEPVLFERLSDHDGGNVLFGDGHVEWIDKKQILKLLQPLRGTPRLTQEEYDAIVAK